MRTRWLRLGLGVLAASDAIVGAWALFFPRSFFADFPGYGRHWVAALPPYNEHLTRDVGALNLAIALMLAVAAVTLGSTIVRTALGATLVYGVPHLIFHLAHSGGMATADRVAQSASLALVVAIAIVLLPLTFAETAAKPDRT